MSGRVTLNLRSKVETISKTNMNNKTTSQHSSSKEYLDELLAELPNPVHKRLIQAYRGNNPVQSMESELGKILMEVLHRED